MGEYLDKLEQELRSEGVGESVTSSSTCVSPSDFDLRTILEIEQATGFKYSDEQKEILKYRGNACILACAGSGKTSTTVHLIAKRIKTGEIKDVDKLVYATYSKAGKDEMKDRLDKLLKQLGVNKQVKVCTLHSFFLNILRLFGVTADIIKDGDRRRMILESCKDAGFIPKDDELMTVDNLISYQINCLLSDRKAIECPVNTLEDLTLEQYSAIRAGYTNRKTAAKLIDYDDMQTYLYLWVVKFAKSPNPQQSETARQIRQYCQAMWHDFYIDEAQDVSKIQFAILKGLITNPEEPNKLVVNLTLIGDDDQCIYAWRGSDPSIILTAAPMFNMRNFVLSTNYRCKSEIVNYAATGIVFNDKRFNKGMSAHEEGGQVKIAVSHRKDLCSLSIVGLNQIKKWIEQGDKESDIAVLVRNNFQASILSNMLLREGIYCACTEESKLTKSNMYADVKMLIEMCEPCWKTAVLSNMLWKMCKYMNTGTARAIANFQDSSALSIKDALGWLIKEFIDNSIQFDSKVTVNLQSKEKMRYYINRMMNDTKADMIALYNALCCEDKAQCLRTLTTFYLTSTSFLYKTEDKQRSITGLVVYINNLVKKDGFDNMKDFLRVTEQYESGRMGIIGDKLTISTIHSAKGREWKDVVMLACDNVSQPSFDGIAKMIDDGVPVADICDRLDEDRRLFYVGNTRAKENLLIVTYEEPSVFILEALGLFKAKDGFSNNSKIVELASMGEGLGPFKGVADDLLLKKDSKYYYEIDWQK